MMRAKGLLLLNAVLLLLLTGCWSRVEVNDVSIITASGIDKTEDGKIRLTLQIIVPKLLGQGGATGGGGGGGGKSATVVVSEKGETALDAYRRLQEKLPRKLFYSHSRVIVIGEKAARDGVSPLLDFFSRYRESRLRNYILFTKGEAADILNLPPKWEGISAEEIREEEKQRIVMSTYLKDFYDMLLTDGVEPIAAQVEPQGLETGGKGLSRNGKEKRPAVTGAAVFHKDKLVGWMSDKETRGVQWLRKEFNEAVITVDVPQNKGGGKISVRVLKGEAKINPVIKGSKVTIKAVVRTEDELYDNSSKLDLTKPEVIDYIEKKVDSDIKDRIQLALDVAQKQFKSDVFGFGREVYREHPKEWKKQFKKRWDQEFPKVKVDIASHATVVRTGLTNKSLSWEDKELKK